MSCSTVFGFSSFVAHRIFADCVIECSGSFSRDMVLAVLSSEDCQKSLGSTSKTRWNSVQPRRCMATHQPLTLIHVEGILDHQFTSPHAFCACVPYRCLKVDPSLLIVRKYQHE